MPKKIEMGAATIPAEVQGIRVGEGVLITSPAELLVEIGCATSGGVKKSVVS